MCVVGHKRGQHISDPSAEQRQEEIISVAVFFFFPPSAFKRMKGSFHGHLLQPRNDGSGRGGNGDSRKEEKRLPGKISRKENREQRHRSIFIGEREELFTPQRRRPFSSFLRPPKREEDDDDGCCCCCFCSLSLSHQKEENGHAVRDGKR